MEAPKYIKQILTDLKGEIDCNTVTIGDVNGPLTSTCRSSRWKIIRKHCLKWYFKPDGVRYL